MLIISVKNSGHHLGKGCILYIYIYYIRVCIYKLCKNLKHVQKIKEQPNYQSTQLL